MEQSKVERLVFDTYLAVIKNSVGTNMFRNFYAKVDGEKIDVMNNGELSCAFFASSVLKIFKLVREIHGTVNTTVKDLLDSGWEKAGEPVMGCVIVWGVEENCDSNEKHKHIGFYIGNEKAISNSSKIGYPTEHNWMLDNRKIELILQNPSLRQSGARHPLRR